MQTDLPPNLLEKIEKTISGRLRVTSFDWAGEKFWVKRAVPDKRKLWHRGQGIVARAVPLPILRPTASPGGSAALAREAERIIKFQAAGFAVPRVLALTPGWLLLSDLGWQLEHRLKHDRAVSDAMLAEDVAAAAIAVAKMHKAGFAHGRASLRDIVRTPDGTLGFIDFEEEVEKLPLPVAQARDLWLFSCSAARYEARVPGLGERMVKTYFAVYDDAAMQRELKNLLVLLRPAAGLMRPFAPALRKDMLHGYLATRTLSTALRA